MFSSIGLMELVELIELQLIANYLGIRGRARESSMDWLFKSGKEMNLHI
jgi:hypothetical protein